MRWSIVSSGMLVVMAYILVMVKSGAAFPGGYQRILAPEDIIEGWHKNKANHYKFERSLRIRRDHPSDRYSSTNMYWPGERWPLRAGPATNKGMIISFECINRTPGAVRALMRVIQGGVGSPDLGLEVLYAPVQFMLMNFMTITCYVYTEGSETETSDEESMWEPLDIETNDKQIESNTDTYAIPYGYGGNGRGFQGKSLGRTRPKPTQADPDHWYNCPDGALITIEFGDGVAKKKEVIRIRCHGYKSPSTSRTRHIGNNSPRKLRENSSNKEINTSSFSSIRTTPTTAWTAYEVTSSKFLDTESPQAICRTEKVSFNVSDQSPQNETAIKIQSADMNLARDLASYDTFRMSLKTISENFQDEQDENTKTRRSIDEVTEPLAYKSVLKIMPIDLKKKIGLAKITY